MFSSVVALYGVPRTGTSWLGEILDSCPNTVYRFQPLFSYRFKNRIKPEDTQEDLERFFRELYEENSDEFLNHTEERKSGKYPVFEKDKDNLSILTYKEVRYLYTIPILLKFDINIKVIGIVRNPVDMLESWLNSPAGYKNEWNVYEEWRLATKKNEYKPENYFGYYKWKECIKMFVDMQQAYSDKFLIVRYEDLVTDAIKETKRLFSFANIAYTEQTERFIEDSQNRTNSDAYSVYRIKGEKSERNIYLPEGIKKEIAKDLESFKEAQMLNY